MGVKWRESGGGRKPRNRARHASDKSSMSCPEAIEPPLPAAVHAVVGQDPTHLSILQRAIRFAPTRTPVLVTGESGTGKELLARLLHEAGPSPGGPFVAVNCGALSRELAESELFGHERGAFTGASTRRLGWFGEAAGGTLVLDEIGELPAELQPKLLRVLETGRYRRVGGQGEMTANVRIVALTLRDLRAEAAARRFRPDLFYRLAGIELRLPPLRQRRGDILVLAHHFVAECRPEVGPRTLSEAARAKLCAHDWPGNVRELRHAIRRAAVLSDGVIEPEHLELDLAPSSPTPGGRYESMATHAGEPAAAAPIFALPPMVRSVPTGAGASLSLEGRSYLELQRDIFCWALRENGGSRRRAARALGISRSTFCDRVKRLKIA